MNEIADFTISSKLKGQVSHYRVFEPVLAVKDEAIESLISEGGEEFYNFVISTGHSLNSRLIVLSSRHHYYYDSDDLKKVKSIVILKKLNRIKEIESFLKSHLNNLPENCNLIGCFINNIKIERYALRVGSTNSERIKNSDNIELGIVSKNPFLNMIYSLMDARTNSYMSETRVTFMLNVHGFKVIKMTESDGLTYFHARKTESHFININ